MPDTQDAEADPSDGPPLAGYEELGAREVMRAILDLPVEALLKLHGWEERHRRRAHVLGAIRRAIERRRASEGA
jgi:hypothetical protein